MPGCEALTASRSCCCAVLKQDCPRLSNSSHDVGAMEKKLTIRPPTVAEYEGDARVGKEEEKKVQADSCRKRKVLLLVAACQASSGCNATTHAGFRR